MRSLYVRPYHVNPVAPIFLQGPVGIGNIVLSDEPPPKPDLDFLARVFAKRGDGAWYQLSLVMQ